MRDKGFKNLKEYLKNKIGRQEFILIEKNKDKFSTGKDQHYVKVKISEAVIEGNIISCVYTGIHNVTLLAKSV